MWVVSTPPTSNSAPKHWQGENLSWLLMFLLSPFSRQLTTVLSHAEVSGCIRATGGKESSFTCGSKLNGGGGGAASMSAMHSSPLLADGTANEGTNPTPLSDNGGGSGNDGEAPTVPETSSWSGSSSAATSESGSNDDDTEQRESADRSGSDTRTETPGRSDRGREASTKTIPGKAETEGVTPTGSAPPQLDCLRGRWGTQGSRDRKSVRWKVIISGHKEVLGRASQVSISISSTVLRTMGCAFRITDIVFFPPCLPARLRQARARQRSASLAKRNSRPGSVRRTTDHDYPWKSVTSSERFPPLSLPRDPFSFRPLSDQVRSRGPQEQECVRHQEGSRRYRRYRRRDGIHYGLTHTV